MTTRRRSSRLAQHRRPALAGTNTCTTCTRAASGSSARATTRNLVAAWLPALDGVVEKLETRAHGGRRRLRPRRVDHPHGAGLPQLDVRRLRLPRGSIETARARAEAAGVSDRVRFDVGAGRVVPAARVTTWSPCSTACTTWAIRSARPATSAGARAGRHVDDRRAVRRRPRRGQPEPGGRAFYGVLDPALHAGFAVTGGRPGARRPGRRSAHSRGRGGGGFTRFRAPPRRRSTWCTRRVRDTARSSSPVRDIQTRTGAARIATASGFTGSRTATATRRSCSCPPGRSSTPACWKLQIPDFARRHRVVTFDPRGNGRSTGRPTPRRTPRTSSPPTRWP